MYAIIYLFLLYKKQKYFYIHAYNNIHTYIYIHIICNLKLKIFFSF